MAHKGRGAGPSGPCGLTSPCEAALFKQLVGFKNRLRYLFGEKCLIIATQT